MNRIAIIHPAPTFENHPTLRNAAVLLARAGYSVDVFIQRHPSFLPPVFAEPEIRVRFMPALAVRLRESRLQQRLLRLLGRAAAAAIDAVSLTVALLPRHLRSRYRLLVGVDPSGIVLASSVSRILQVPTAYMSLELLLASEVSSPTLRLLKVRERRASRRARFVLVQDEERASLLRQDNRLARDRFVLVPNAPLAAERRRSRHWHEKFGLPATERVVLYAGSYAPWTGLAEIIGSTSTWPEGWSLVVHLRKRPSEEELEPLREAAAPGRVVFSTEAVPQEELDNLFAAADVGIAFYLVQPELWYTQENLRTVGLSSGKIAYYLRAGLPVIVNDGSSLADFVREEACGLVVREPGEIGPTLDRIVEGYDLFSEEARRAFAERLDFAGSFAEVIRRVDSLSSGRAGRV